MKRTVKASGSLGKRREGPEGSNFTITLSDSNTLSRIRVGMASHPELRFRVFAAVQDSRARFYKTTPSNDALHGLVSSNYKPGELIYIAYSSVGKLNRGPR